MAGMQAGAADEITVPIDTDTLRATIASVCSTRKTKRKRSIFKMFGDAMAAVAFAQAGEFDTAVDLLDGPKRDNPPHRKK